MQYILSISEFPWICTHFTVANGFSISMCEFSRGCCVAGSSGERMPHSGHFWAAIYNHSHALSHALRGYVVSHMTVFDGVVFAASHMVSRGCCRWSRCGEQSWRTRFCPRPSTERFEVSLWRRFWSTCCQSWAYPVSDWLSAHQRSRSNCLNWMSRGWVNDGRLNGTSWLIE